jgi:uncharacterized protein (TIGR02996 family)
MNEDAFLQAILANPKDNDSFLVYSDWLEEQGDPVSAAKAEFLRLTVAPSIGKGKKGQKKAKRKRLQQLAAGLDTDWLAVVSRPGIENCLAKRKEEEDDSRSAVRSMNAYFEFLCERKWRELQPTDDHGVRFCDGCRQRVFFCDTIGEARTHADKGHCIAVDLGVIRRPGDLAPQLMVLGWPSSEALRREEERMQPDAVSAERERRKREARGGQR